MCRIGAGVAEPGDAAHSQRAGRKPMGVQVSPPAPWLLTRRARIRILDVRCEWAVAEYAPQEVGPPRGGPVAFPSGDPWLLRSRAPTAAGLRSGLGTRPLERELGLAGHPSRSQRGAVHISPSYRPNHMDSKYLIEAVRWCLTDTLRTLWNGDREEVARAIRAVLQCDVPLLEWFNSRRCGPPGGPGRPGPGRGSRAGRAPRPRATAGPAPVLPGRRMRPPPGFWRGDASLAVRYR